jgi:hypothetical protein
MGQTVEPMVVAPTCELAPACMHRVSEGQWISEGVQQTVQKLRKNTWKHADRTPRREMQHTHHTAVMVYASSPRILDGITFTLLTQLTSSSFLNGPCPAQEAVTCVEQKILLNNFVLKFRWLRVLVTGGWQGKQQLRGSDDGAGARGGARGRESSGCGDEWGGWRRCGAASVRFFFEPKANLSTHITRWRRTETKATSLRSHLSSASSTRCRMRGFCGLITPSSAWGQKTGRPT